MSPERQRGSFLGVTLQILGAFAGLTALTAAVGGAVLWIRFDALSLPADHAVALLPRSLLLVIGAHALVAPVLIGLAVAVLILVMNPLNECDRMPRRRLSVLWLFILAGGAVALYLGVEGLDLKYQLPMYIIGLFALFVLIASARAKQTRGRDIALITFAAFALCGAAMAVLRTAGRPMMEPVAVLLKDGKGLSGFHVATTDDFIYVATLEGEGDLEHPFADAPVDRVLEVPRDEVRRRAARAPMGVRADAGGRDQAQTLLADLRARYEPQTKADALSLADPVGDLAPLVNLHSEEKFWPISVGEYLANSTLYWKHSEKCPEWRAVDDEHVGSLAENPEKVLPHIDPSRLGATDPAAKTYAHPPTCNEVGRTPIPATAVTRPFERRDKAVEVAPLDEGFFLDAATLTRKGAGRKRKQGSQLLFEQVPVYYEWNDEEARPPGKRKGKPKPADRRRITYWLFYAYSRSPGPEAVVKAFDHEGDWERLSVLVERVRPKTGRVWHWTPISVRYHFHDENRDVPWSSVRLARDEQQVAKDAAPTHPVAYVGRFSHATYPRAGRFEERVHVGGRIVSASDDAIACSECPQWRSWHFLRNAKVQYWYGFGGAWGLVRGAKSSTGPLGPSARKSLFEPEPRLADQIKERQQQR